MTYALYQAAMVVCPKCGAANEVRSARKIQCLACSRTYRVPNPIWFDDGAGVELTKNLTLPELRRTYYANRRSLIESEANKWITQTEAAKNLGVSLANLNNILRREGISWPEGSKWKRSK